MNPENEISLTSKKMVWLFSVSRETLRNWREKGMPYFKKKRNIHLKHA
jgi:phage terminase Nu1 subunit (DNA packaging protein)